MKNSVFYLKNKAIYHKRFLSETAMFRVKKLLRRTLSFIGYNAQISEIYGMIKALNMLAGLSMLNMKVIF
ncbi:Mobile element protein [Candidatus Enterovibrio altilux]|uniref:Mobile element protein n=1 Tax=Candidatus Enterovibrio altilux TaxID=1927128 RepID=A0A291BB32_9GAMM|nr:Mobile element protein [Candidatus Enterovibrio luxaltus]